MPANRVEKFYSETAKAIEELEKGEYIEQRLESTLRSIDLHYQDILPNSSEFKEKFNPGKLVSTAKMEPKQIIFKN